MKYADNGLPVKDCEALLGDLQETKYWPLEQLEVKGLAHGCDVSFLSVPQASSAA